MNFLTNIKYNFDNQYKAPNHFRLFLTLLTLKTEIEKKNSLRNSKYVQLPQCVHSRSVKNDCLYETVPNSVVRRKKVFNTSL